MIIGLTGKRGVGKSELAKLFVERGFTRVHAFGGGKEMAMTYFRRCGASESTAWEMANGTLKDLASEFLPGNQTPRFFMEKLGKFMGTTMGYDWTLGVEIDRVLRENPRANIIVESVVYEAPLLRRLNGLIVRVVRPDFEGPAGCETDAAEAVIEADLTLFNRGSLSNLPAAFEALMQEIYG